MNQRNMLIGVAIGLAVSLSVASQLTGGGMTKVTLNSDPTNILVGSGTTAYPLLGKVYTDGVTVTGTGSAGSGFVASASTEITTLNYGLFGDGSDGAINFDGSTTVLGLVPSGSTYTLNRAIFLNGGTMGSGVRIITAGYQIYDTGTFNCTNGTFSRNGGNGGNGGATGTAGTAGAAAAAGYYGGSLAGGTGNAGGPTANSSAMERRCTAGGLTGLGAVTVGNTPVTGTDGGICQGAVGGNGGRSNGGANGGATSAVGTGALVPATSGDLRSESAYITGSHTSKGTVITWSMNTGGSGGGLGGGAVNPGGGGGGGASGGYIFMSVRKFNITGSCTVESKGGNGGNGGTAAGAGSGGGGGGGGGAGGIIVLRIGSLPWPTYTTTGGSPGTFGNGNAGSQNGAAGGTGGAGFTIPILAGIP